MAASARSSRKDDVSELQILANGHSRRSVYTLANSRRHFYITHMHMHTHQCTQTHRHMTAISEGKLALFNSRQVHLHDLHL
uniref:WD_REPEATS_REGION domain-containing protein n=1 Tax=Ascaris lumbricoides TaxID=6252 RepID=A0A0M3ICC3_ASCLU